MELKGLCEDAMEAAPVMEIASPESPQSNPLVAPDAQKVEEVRSTLALVERLKGYSRASDVFADFSVNAAARTVIEMETARSSSDRRKAAEVVLGYDLGKPVNRQVSMNMSPSDMGDEELKSKCLDLMAKLGLQVSGDRSKLVIESRGVRETLPASGGLKPGAGPEQVEESEASPEFGAGEVR